MTFIENSISKGMTNRPTQDEGKLTRVAGAVHPSATDRGIGTPVVSLRSTTATPIQHSHALFSLMGLLTTQADTAAHRACSWLGQYWFLDFTFTRPLEPLRLRPQTTIRRQSTRVLFSPVSSRSISYQYPDWFRDSKLGIWAHWGPQAVPMFGDWYARHLYVQGHRQYQDHLEHYGHPTKLGHKDIIPLWKAEKWDPDRLMAMYKKAGTRYFVSMGVHHDNFDLWNSTHQKWNAVKMGPHRDVVGDWQKAAKKLGLRFGVSEHLGTASPGGRTAMARTRQARSRAFPTTVPIPSIKIFITGRPRPTTRVGTAKTRAGIASGSAASRIWSISINPICSTPTAASRLGT